MKRYRKGKNRCKICGWKLDDGNSHRHFMARLKAWAKETFLIPEKKPAKAKKEPKKLPLFEGGDNV